ncbi:cilia- and flagella-associated protein 65-like [Diorhabda carinulata]|uniref:cilia- and flagella-associated protein 65-like n=1 Tax=Diorhabda carinulata TaxID=1163345 RepID=UPI0025A1AB98|nr:cilia- and flagella-associated protein 65-like [Diorhabda carinulata]
MNPKCTCTEKSTPHPCTSHIAYEAAKNISIHFEKTPFFHETSKTIDIDLNNNQQGVTRFKIKRAITLYQDYEFWINPKNGVIEKGAKKLKLECFYRPKVPFVRNVQTFECDIGRIKITITATGESTGPIVTASERHIYFHQTPKNRRGKQIFALKNATNIPAEFMFDIDTKQKLFTVTPLKGVINKEMYIKVFFNPKEFGIYSQKLYCLILGNEPIVVNVTGIYGEEQLDPNKLSYIHYPFVFEETILYDGYFKNFIETSIYKKNSPVYLTPRYIDMGKIVQVEEKILEPDYDIQQNSSDTSQQNLFYSFKNFNITNDMKHNITVNWIEDDPIFNIFPKVATIPGQQSKYFKCVFSPPNNESVYFRKLTAQIYWRCDFVENHHPNQTFIVPLTLSINLQGNSFPKGQHTLTDVEMKPPRIVFPPTVVNTVIYENFTIINKLNRPVIFKLVPPPDR